MERTQGTLLGGQVSYKQPRHGYRTGIEPVFLAAVIPARPGDRVLEAGCGAGAGLLCLTHRVPGLHATGIELEPDMAALARENLAENGRIAAIATADVSMAPSLGPFDHVFANPPWHDPAATRPPAARRALATHGDALARWIEALASATSPGGSLTLAIPAAQAKRAATWLDTAGFMQKRLWRLIPKPGRAPKVVLLQATHGRSAAWTHDWVLHHEDHGYTNATERVLRSGAGLVECEDAPHPTPEL